LHTTEYAIALILERLKFLQPVFRLSLVIGIISGGLAITSLQMARYAMDAPLTETTATSVIEMGQQKLLELRQLTMPCQMKLMADMNLVAKRLLIRLFDERFGQFKNLAKSQY
jgi:hypothetical protein